MSVLSLFLLASMARADLSASALVESVQANFDAIRTLSCSLTMTSSVVFTRTGVAQAATTAVYRYWLKRPDKMRVETPDGNALIRDGARSWRFTPGGGSIELPRATAVAPVALPPAMLWNLRDALLGLGLRLNGVVDGRQVLEGWPSSAGSGPGAHHELCVGPGGVVYRIQLFDPSGTAYHRTTVTSAVMGGVSVPSLVVESFQSPANVTTLRYEFSDLRLNDDLPDSLFRP